MTQQTTKLAVEVLSSTNVWTDVSAALQSGTVGPLGFANARLISPQIGRAQLMLVNTSGVYGADKNGNGTALLRPRRRIRIKATGKSLGKALQVQHSGTSGTVGGTVTSTQTSATAPIGYAGTETRDGAAQTFKVLAQGQLTQFTIVLAANTGSPVGTMTWTIRADDAIAPGTNPRTPGTVLATGTFTPVASSTNTIAVSGGPGLVPGLTYWLILQSTSNQSSGVFWNWQRSANNAGTYADGQLWDNDAAAQGDSWYQWGGLNNDCSFSVTTSPVSTFFSQQVTVAVGIGDVLALNWNARSTFDSQFNVDFVRIITSAENGAFTQYTYDNKKLPFTLSFTATAIATSITVQFWGQGNGTPGNAAVIEYSAATLTKNGGANLLVNGDFSSGVISPWSLTNAAAGTNTATVIDDYWFLFNGFIDKVTPSSAIIAGTHITKVDCVDWVNVYNTQTLDQPLQKVQRGDQLNSTVLAGLPSGTLNTTQPGITQDTGKQTFQLAFDGYLADKTLITQALTDTALSEYGGWWVDRDGTFRFGAVDFKVRKINQANKLTIANGQAFSLSPASDGTYIVNKVKVTYTPRQSVANVTLGTIQSSISIPPPANGATYGTTTFTVTYRDTNSGRVIGGNAVIYPVAVTDFKISDNAIYANKSFDYTVNIVGQGGNNTIPVPTFVISASQITCTFSNPYIGTLYVNTFVVRGTGIYTWDPITVTVQDNALVAADMVNLWAAVMPYTDNGIFVNTLASYIVQRYKNPILEVTQLSVSFQTNLNGVDLLSLEIGDAIAVSDVDLGITALRHIIVGAMYTIDTVAGDTAISGITFLLERLDDNTYGIWDDTTYGIYDSTMVYFI